MDTTPSNALARLRRAVFARHAHPWSAWTRWASTPLVLVPVWTRRRSHAAVVGAWMALNPVVFPQPADERAWASRAMLGEELWITDRPRDAALGVNAAATAAGLVAILAARHRRPVPAATATAAQMALLLVYWELMTRYLDHHRQADVTPRRPAARQGTGLLDASVERSSPKDAVIGGRGVRTPRAHRPWRPKPNGRRPG